MHLTAADVWRGQIGAWKATQCPAFTGTHRNTAFDCCIDTSLLHTNRFDTNTSIPFTHFLLFSTEERERSSFLRKLWGPLTGSVPTNLSELCSDSPEGDATTMLLDHLLSDHLQITCLKISFFSCFWTLRFGQSSVRLKSWKLFSWACPRGWFDLHRAY